MFDPQEPLPVDGILIVIGANSVLKNSIQNDFETTKKSDGSNVDNCK